MIKMESQTKEKNKLKDQKILYHGQDIITVTRNPLSPHPCFSSSYYSCQAVTLDISQGTRLLYRLHGLADPARTLQEIYHCLMMPSTIVISKQYAQFARAAMRNNSEHNSQQSKESLFKQLCSTLRPEQAEYLLLKPHQEAPFPALTYQHATPEAKRIFSQQEWQRRCFSMHRALLKSKLGLRASRRQQLERILKRMGGSFDKTVYTDKNKESTFLLSQQISLTPCIVVPMQSVLEQYGKGGATDRALSEDGEIIGAYELPQQSHIDELFHDVLRQLERGSFSLREIGSFLNPANWLVIYNHSHRIQKCIVNPILQVIHQLPTWQLGMSLEQTILQQPSACQSQICHHPIDFNRLLKKTQGTKLNSIERQQISFGISWLLFYDHITSLTQGKHQEKSTVLMQLQQTSDGQKMDLLKSCIQEGEERGWAGPASATLILSRMSSGVQKQHSLCALRSPVLLRVMEKRQKSAYRISRLQWVQLLCDLGLQLIQGGFHIRRYYQGRSTYHLTPKTPNSMKYKSIFYFCKMLLYILQTLVLQFSLLSPCTQDQLKSLKSSIYHLQIPISFILGKFKYYRYSSLSNRNLMEAYAEQFQFIQTVGKEHFGVYSDINKKEKPSLSQLEKSMAIVKARCIEEMKLLERNDWWIVEGQQNQQQLLYCWKVRCYQEMLIKLSKPNYVQLRGLEQKVKKYQWNSQAIGLNQEFFQQILKQLSHLP